MKNSFTSLNHRICGLGERSSLCKPIETLMEIQMLKPMKLDRTILKSCFMGQQKFISTHMLEPVMGM